MTNKARQQWLDKRKWLDSEVVKHDMGGNYLHCDYCNKQIPAIDHWECFATQEERETQCLCATAFNRFYKRYKANDRI